MRLRSLAFLPTTRQRDTSPGGYAIVEFQLDEIENLPAAHSSVDAVMSNCVIKPAADKNWVRSEAHRVSETRRLTDDFASGSAERTSPGHQRLH
jgi:ubiquinone/menaquinone biosynthesis C-methylase UbiE